MFINNPQIQIKSEHDKVDAYPLQSRSSSVALDIEFETVEPQVARQFWVIFRVLHAFGSSPVQIQYGSGKNSGKLYSFKLCSRSSTFTLCMALFFTALWIKFMIELGFNQIFIGNSFRRSKEYFYEFTRSRSYGNPMDENVNSHLVSPTNAARFLMFVFPVEHVLALVFSWWDSALLTTFLNNWHSIEMSYFTLFFPGSGEGALPGNCNNNDKNPKQNPNVPKLSMINLTSWRNKRLLLYAGLPTITFWPLYVNSSVHYDDVVQILVVVFGSIHFIIFPLFDDMKTVFMYKVMAEAFHQVKLKLSRSLNDNSDPTFDDAEFLNPKNLRSCRHLLELIRRQCRLLGKLQTKQELTQLASTFAILTLEIYILFNGDHSHKHAHKVLLVITVLTVWITNRLYLKASMADKITEEEREIAELMVVSESNSSNLDPLVSAEAKFIHDMILLHPSEIVLGNYLTYNKKLILTIFSQIVMYIIVLMQLTNK